MKITISKCKCGHPVCNKYHIDQSGADGMFEKEEAEYIAQAVNFYDQLIKTHEALAKASVKC